MKKKRTNKQSLPENCIVLRPIFTNAGIESAYRKELRAIIKQIRKDVLLCLKKHYPKNMAKDGYFDDLEKAFNGVIYTWTNKIDEMADKIAKSFVTKSLNYINKAFNTAFKEKSLPTVKFKMTREVRQATKGVLFENVSLIKSIPQKYLNDVETQVWQAINGGFDLGKLADNLAKTYQITERRANLIARDQTNKAKATIEQARRRELGITHAIWQHSHAGKQPRPSHVKADGEMFDIEKGLYLDGEWTLPAVQINCRCTSRAVIEV